MAKFRARIGYVESQETAPGVFTLVPTEKYYTGDLLANNQSWQNGDRVNDNITFSNKISIVADPFAQANFEKIRYVRWAGTRWKVKNIQYLRPRIVLTLGEVYNGD